MADVHIRIEVQDGPPSGLSKAVRDLQDRDGDFPSLLGGESWWHKPPDNARGVVARALSRQGLRGRLSVEPHRDGDDWDTPPPPRWTGFVPGAK